MKPIEEKLGNLVSFTRGLTYSKNNEVEKEGVAVLRATNIDLFTSKLVLDEIKYIDSKINIKEEKFALPGDILICTASGSKSHLGKVALIEKDQGMVFGGFMAVLRCKSSCNPKFLHLILTSSRFKSYLNRISDGANINNLKFSQIENFKIFLPSLDAQQKIVDKLYTAFAEIDKNITNIQKIKDEFLILKANVIKERFKESHENIQRYFHEVCTLKRGYDLPKVRRKRGEFPLLSANGTTDYIDSFKIKGPGVVTGRSGTIGKVHFIEKDFHPLNTALYVKDFKGNAEKYIYYLLTSFNLKRFSSGAGVPTLNRNVLSNEAVFINSDRKKQFEISKVLDSIELEIRKLITIMIKKEELFHLLKSKILSKELQSDIL